MSEFQVKRRRFTESRIVESDARPDIADGEILTRIERFAFTANNITYAVAGDMLGYWQFFAPQDDAANEWGLIPVWGFAEVVESRAQGVAPGERLFGYFPPAHFLKMQPAQISEQRLTDDSPHRANLPAMYNNYIRVANEPGYDPANDALRMLLWPLYITSMFIWDQMQENDWYGAEQVLVLSASSKTSIGLAYALSLDANAPGVIGLTSDRNHAFVSELGVYDQALSYQALAGINAGKPTIIVDMSGDAELNNQLQSHLGEALKYTIRVGLTHWDAADSDSPNGPKSEFFFAPARIQKRMQDWGADGFAQKTTEFMAGAMRHADGWLQVEKLDGLPGLSTVYADVCDGTAAPNQGLVVEM